MGQPRKDNKQRRVNFDNTRISKFEKDIKKGKSRKGSGPRITRESKSMDTNGMKNVKYVDGTNDVAWYAKTPELLRAAASVPFSVVNGQPIPVSLDRTESIPNTMALYWNPTISGMGDEAINQAADSMYSFIVHANSRNYRYNAPDLMLLILAGASFFSMLALGIRTYGVMRNYDQRNLYMPDDWISLSGFNVEDLKSNLSNMWFDLNQLIAMSQQIWIPNTMPAITRWFWMNSNIYMDANSAKSQFYMYVPNTYWQYSETGDEHGGSLISCAWNRTPSGNYIAAHTWEQYMTIMRTMLNNLINSEDRGIIFGDILKAYGSEKIYSVSPITSDYTVSPVYNPEVLTQIENTTCWCYYPDAWNILDTTTTPTSYGGVYQNQDTVRLYSRVKSATAAQVSSGTSLVTKDRRVPLKPFLNFHQQTTPTPEQIMVATRLMACGVKVSEVQTDTSGKPTTYWFSPAVCGTEFISSICMSQYTTYIPTQTWQRTTKEVYQCRSFENVFPPISGTTTWSIPSAVFMAYVSFDWAPIYYLNMPGSVLTSTEISKYVPGYVLPSENPWTVLCDFDNWTTLDLEVLGKMHTAAIYSEFGVPVIM